MHDTALSGDMSVDGKGEIYTRLSGYTYPLVSEALKLPLLLHLQLENK